MYCADAEAAARIAQPFSLGAVTCGARPTRNAQSVDMVFEYQELQKDIRRMQHGIT
jgi:hypothetical protein